MWSRVQKLPLQQAIRKKKFRIALVILKLTIRYMLELNGMMCSLGIQTEDILHILAVNQSKPRSLHPIKSHYKCYSHTNLSLIYKIVASVICSQAHIQTQTCAETLQLK